MPPGIEEHIQALSLEESRKKHNPSQSASAVYSDLITRYRQAPEQLSSADRRRARAAVANPHLSGWELLSLILRSRVYETDSEAGSDSDTDVVEVTG